MNAADGFVVVYDLLESGYRGTEWALIFGGLLFLVLLYLLLLRPDSRGERAYRLVLSLIWLLVLCLFSVYHIRTYTAYQNMVIAMEWERVQQTVGVISFVQAEGYFLYFDVDGERFRSSSSQWPFWLGFQPDDFLLQPGFLVRISTQQDIVIRLEVHKVHLN